MINLPKSPAKRVPIVWSAPDETYPAIAYGKHPFHLERKHLALIPFSSL